MNAGRELDALVGEKVMGREVLTFDPITMEPGLLLTVPGETMGWPNPGVPGPIPVTERCPAFSTDIAAAWDVFQHIMRTMYFSRRDVFFKALLAEATLADGAVAQGLWALQVLKDRFPEAICRAALAAVGAEVPA